MSNIPTWKNVAAPDYNSANWLLSQGAKTQEAAFDRGADMFADFEQKGRDKNTGEAMAEIAQMNSLENFDQQKADFLSGMNMGGVDQTAVMNSLGDRQNTLYSNDAMDYERKYRDQLMQGQLAGLSGRGGGGSGGGGGRGGAGGGSLSFGGLTGEKAMYAMVGAAAEYDDNGNFLPDETQKKLLSVPGNEWANNKYYLSNYNKHHVGSNTDLGMRNSARAAVLKDTLKNGSNGEGGEKKPSAKDFHVGTGVDAPSSSIMNRKSNAKNAANYNTRADNMIKNGATIPEMREFEAESLDWFTGSLDSTDGAAGRIHDRVIQRGKVTRAEEDDPVTKRFRSQM